MVSQASTIIGLYKRMKMSTKLSRRRVEIFFEDARSKNAGVGLQITMDELEGLVPIRVVIWGVTALDEIGA